MPFATGQSSTPVQSGAPQDEHPRIFWIVPTHTVVDGKPAGPLSTAGKFRLFVKDKTDPFIYDCVNSDLKSSSVS